MSKRTVLVVALAGACDMHHITGKESGICKATTTKTISVQKSCQCLKKTCFLMSSCLVFLKGPSSFPPSLPPPFLLHSFYFCPFLLLGNEPSDSKVGYACTTEQHSQTQHFVFSHTIQALFNIQLEYRLLGARFCRVVITGISQDGNRRTGPGIKCMTKMY